MLGLSSHQRYSSQICQAEFGLQCNNFGEKLYVNHKGAGITWVRQPNSFTSTTFVSSSSFPFGTFQKSHQLNMQKQFFISFLVSRMRLVLWFFLNRRFVEGTPPPAASRQANKQAGYFWQNSPSLEGGPGWRWFCFASFVRARGVYV